MSTAEGNQKDIANEDYPKLQSLENEPILYMLTNEIRRCGIFGL